MQESNEDCRELTEEEIDAIAGGVGKCMDVPKVIKYVVQWAGEQVQSVVDALHH